MMSKQLPDATPQPGELAADIAQTGYLSGFFMNNYNGEAFVDRSFIEDEQLAKALSLKGIEDIRKKISGWARKQYRERYLEEFVEEVEREKENIPAFYKAIEQLEEKHALPHPIGIGFVGFHFYREDKLGKRKLPRMNISVEINGDCE